MDTVFCFYNEDPNTKVYLLDEWRVDKYGKVSKWVQTVTTTGVGGRKINFLPICNFAHNNISWVGKSVLTSITIEIWENIKKDLRYDASVSEVFCTIIQKQQQVNSSAVCALDQSLQK